MLIVISGFSGAGKGTLIRRLMAEHWEDYALSVSATTRAPRPGEVDGKDYFFLDKARFQEMIHEDRLLEYARYVDNYYGTPRDYVEEQMRAGRISGASYATLLDRMLMREGRPQRYGTQTHASMLLVDGAPQRVERICRLWPVESPERLDSLREAVGLEPIDDYLRAVGESYGAPCTWDPTLGVEAFSEE